MANNTADEAIKNANVDSSPKFSGRQSNSSTSKSNARSSSAPTGPKAPPDKLSKSLSKLYGNVGMMLYPFDQQCGAAILENSETMAQSLADLAKENDAVRRVLNKVVESGAMGTVIAAHAPVVLAVAGHHGPQVAGLFTKKDKTADEDTPNDTEPLFDMDTGTPPSYTHPGDNAT